MRTKEVGTRKYEFAHGTKPRGNGNWWFHYTVWTPQGNEITFEANFQGSYSKAKAEALYEAHQHDGDVVVEVMS